MKKTIIGSIALSLVGLASSASTAGAASQRVLVLSGPVEATNVAAGNITVLGHLVFTADASRVVVGQRVNVYGVLDASGVVQNALLESQASYVAGADSIYMRGVVTATNAAYGYLEVGATRVDYTSLLANPNFKVPAVGQSIEFAGTQPAAGGIVLASRASTRAAISNGGGVESEISNGGGFGSAISNGGGVEAEISNGGGVRRAISNGGGVASEISNGGGFRSAISNGGGFDTEISNGGGMRSAISNGGGFDTEISNGGGLRSAISNGGGVNSEISNGGGVRSAISNGGGINTKISNGGGVHKAISNGGGTSE